MASSSATTKTKGRSGSFVSEVPNLSRRLVLVGMTGAGKSSSGNTILGRKAFRAAKSGSSVTKECGKQSELVAGREITVVDTPGLFDTDVPEEDLLKQEISKCINMTAPGPHAILLIIKISPFTEEERDSVKKIRAIFENADKHTLIIFTHGDKLTGTIEEFIKEANDDLKEVLRRCGERYHVFKNKDMEDRNQVVELLEKVDKMISDNKDRYYTNSSYQDVEKTLKDKEEKLRREYEKKLQEKETELKFKFKEEKQKLDERLNEYKRYYEAKIREFRLEEERAPISEKILKNIIEKLKCLKVKI